MATVTMKSRPLTQLCGCGRQVVRYLTSQGWKSAPYCPQCSQQGSVSGSR